MHVAQCCAAEPARPWHTAGSLPPARLGTTKNVTSYRKSASHKNHQRWQRNAITQMQSADENPLLCLRLISSGSSRKGMKQAYFVSFSMWSSLLRSTHWKQSRWAHNSLREIQARLQIKKLSNFSNKRAPILRVCATKEYRSFRVNNSTATGRSKDM